MTSNPPPESDDPHDAVAGLLPWYVNGTLECQERARVKAHLGQCPACRQELAVLRALADRVKATPVPERSPQAAFERLRASLPDREAASPRPARSERATPGIARRPAFLRRYATRLALAATVLLLLAPLGWRQMARLTEPNFRTLSEPAPAAEQGDLRVVFDLSVEAPRIEAILRAVGGSRAGEPGPGGVYTIRLAGGKAGKAEIEAAMAYLRKQEGVLLAEPVERN
jgi:anti-sigma factor RsiW